MCHLCVFYVPQLHTRRCYLLQNLMKRRIHTNVKCTQKSRYEASLKKCFIAVHNLPFNKSPFMSKMRNGCIRVIIFTWSIINNSDVIFCDSTLWYVLTIIIVCTLTFKFVIHIQWKCLWRGCDESWHNFRIRTYLQVMKWQQKLKTN